MQKVLMEGKKLTGTPFVFVNNVKIYNILPIPTQGENLKEKKVE